MSKVQCHLLIDYFNQTLTPEEASVFKKHLVDCPECREELDELNELTLDLPYLSESVPVPEGMKARILEAAYHEDTLKEKSSDYRQNVVSLDTITDQQNKPKLEQNTSVEEFRSRRKRTFLIPSLAAALFLSLASNAYLYYEGTKQNAPVEVGLIQNQVTLTPADQVGEHIAIASLIKENNNDILQLQASKLPELENGEYYQVWLIEGDQPYPTGYFQPDKLGQGTVNYQIELEDKKWDTIAITIEKEPNLPAPEGQIVLAGKI
ncbi:anti-sigma factor domain-containing protein [Metabacillus herbersteinensis]|uniref:Anti-sigma-W factor RsiW n=1 Tax=Metabacillus herbersteinensis TaxID=283816 RepID=A0ABV6GFG7_9BACI